MEDDDPRANLPHKIQIVLDDENAKPLDLDKLGQYCREPLPFDARQSGGRFIQQDDLRFKRKHHRELQRLLQAMT